MSDVSIVVKSNVGDVKNELNRRIPVILEALGLEAQGNAISEITAMDAVDTGRLRNSITFATSTTQGIPNMQGGAPAEPEDYEPLAKAEKENVYIGTNVEYAPYIELGAKGRAARPFLRHSLSKYTEDYKRILKEGLK